MSAARGFEGSKVVAATCGVVVEAYLVPAAIWKRTQT